VCNSCFIKSLFVNFANINKNKNLNYLPCIYTKEVTRDIILMKEKYKLRFRGPLTMPPTFQQSVRRHSQSQTILIWNDTTKALLSFIPSMKEDNSILATIRKCVSCCQSAEQNNVIAHFTTLTCSQQLRLLEWVSLLRNEPKFLSETTPGYTVLQQLPWSRHYCSPCAASYWVNLELLFLRGIIRLDGSIIL
jgi:hypothetical protein